MLASCGASIAFTFSAVIRGVMSENLLTTKGLLCIASFFHGFFYIVIVKIYRHFMNDSTPLGWIQPDRDSKDNPITGTYRLRKRIFGALMVRGVLEFAGSTLLLVTLKIALENDMNQGISTAMMSLAGAMITLLYWLIYNEKLSLTQFIGMGIILLAVIMMGIFQEEIKGEKGDELDLSAADGLESE